MQIANANKTYQNPVTSVPSGENTLQQQSRKQSQITNNNYMIGGGSHTQRIKINQNSKMAGTQLGTNQNSRMAGTQLGTNTKDASPDNMMDKRATNKSNYTFNPKSSASPAFTQNASAHGTFRNKIAQGNTLNAGNAQLKMSNTVQSHDNPGITVNNKVYPHGQVIAMKNTAQQWDQSHQRTASQKEPYGFEVQTTLHNLIDVRPKQLHSMQNTSQK